MTVYLGRKRCAWLGCAVLTILIVHAGCSYRPAAPVTIFSFNDKVQDKMGTVILGPVLLRKGQQVAFRLDNLPTSQFSVGIYFHPKSGPPWFPDSGFPSNCEVQLTVLRDSDRLFTTRSELGKWWQGPWGGNLNDRCLTASLDYRVNEVERWLPTVSYEKGNMTVYKTKDYVDYSSSDYTPPFINSKSGCSYTIEIRVLSTDPRAEALNAFVGVGLEDPRLTP